ncbi:MAG: EAL domain-containing protein [Oceanospirillaceae bacterium]|nr:EAL domain-containing protein [Oceanospirillaceae bacterium]MCP5350039.1 EAL domain-containing protein [Oceanospirillaceae bacterium]
MHAHVLVVEDNPSDALLISRLVESCKSVARVSVAGSGKETMAILQQGDVDLVITDHLLPDCRSEDIIRSVRQSGVDIPVIIVSGQMGEDVAVAAMRSGASDYLVKGALKRLEPAIERELRELVSRRARCQAEQTVAYMAYHDALTGLANRFQLEQTLDHIIEENRHEAADNALLYIDLDQFKLINDTCGHMAGDELLKNLSPRLKKLVRAGDLLARIGGDEFALLLANCPPTKALELAERLRQEVEMFRFSWQGKIFRIGCSIGVAYFGRDGVTRNQVLREADIACYAAKDAGRNRIYVYQEGDGLLQERQEQMNWATRLKQALEQDGFEFALQPIQSMQNPIADGGMYEVLLRMKGEGKGVMPGAFIPAAERYGLMPQLDRWVVEHATRLWQEMSSSLKCKENLIFFINLSAESLTDGQMVTFIQEQLRQNRIPAKQICFEITETSAISNLSQSVRFMGEVRRLGCKFALDDFGTGMCSFNYLKNLPVDYVKIDGNFVRKVLEPGIDSAIVDAINRIAHLVGLQTIAETVEDAATARHLKHLGVDFYQGHWLAEPKLAAEAAADYPAPSPLFAE